MTKRLKHRFSFAKFGRKTFVTISVIVISCGLTYYFGEKRHASRLTALQAQVDSLNDRVLQSRVTQRVSEQMGDIASQQSLIAIQERNRAEKQSQIAMMERGKAEKERGLAMVAQTKALASAAEAKRAQAVAEKQSRLATQNMLIAQEARAHADTLMYMSLVNSMTQTARSQYLLGNENLACLLSYAAWTYGNKYNLKSSRQNIFNALLTTSGTVQTESGLMKGNIRKLHTIDGNIFAVSDYGEVLFNDGRSYVVNIGSYDFRDFYGYGKNRIVCLTSDGKLVEANLSNIANATSSKDIPHMVKLQLPVGVWKRLGDINHGNTLMAMSDNMIVWIDSKTYTIKAMANTTQRTTALGKQSGVIHVFCEKGVHYVSKEEGTLVPLNLSTLKDDRVTAYIYNKARRLQILGMESGEIFIYNESGDKVGELMGHIGPVTELHTWDEMLCSASYDSSLRLWNISDLKSLVVPVTIQCSQWPLSFDVDTKAKMVWTGTERGDVIHFCYDTNQNALNARRKIKHEFTPEEWNLYVGKGIDRQTYMK